MKVLFVTNMCTHYRVGAYETLSKLLSVKFFFYSDGNEPYWEKRNPVGGARIDAETIPGWNILPRIRISPQLVWRLLRDDYDVVIKCINGRFALPVTFVIAKLRRKPFILWQTIWYHPATLFHRLSYPMLKYIWKHTDAFVVYGEHGREFLVAEGIPREKVFVAFQAVDNAVYGRAVSGEEQDDVRKKLGLRSDQAKVILYVGQFIPVKGLSFLIDAYKRVRRNDTTLLLVGRGELEERLREQARAMADVIFAGYVPPAQLAPLYAMATVFVLPSVSTPRVKEAWGLVVNEAMNQGCPAIVTDAVGAGIGGLVLDRNNGYVVHERNAEELANALGRLLNDDVLRRRMSDASKAAVAEFTYPRWASGFVDAVAYASRKH